MSSTASSDRISSLLQAARECIESGNYAKAAAALREASHIEPDNVKVKEAWVTLQSRSETRDGLQSVKDYLGSKTDDDGKKALQALKEGQLGPDDASEAVNLLLAADATDLSSLDALLTVLITSHPDARKAVAGKISKSATDVYELAYVKGDDAFSAFASVTLDDAAWIFQHDAQATAQQDLFRLNVATLMDAGVDHPQRAMKAMARQAAVAPDNITTLLDEDAFGVVLQALDLRQPQTLRSQAMLAVSKMLEVKGEQGEQVFSQYVAKKVSGGTNDDLINAFSVASAVFPIIPSTVAKMFLTEGFVQQLVPNLERNSEAATAGKRKSTTLEQAALELLSAACMDKACRESINRYCAHWLKALAEEREGTNKALAALVLAKVIGDSAENDVTAKLSELVLQDTSASDQAIEGQAYTSLQPKVKQDIASNTKLLKLMVMALKERPSVTFGCLTAFANLTAYRPLESEEQKRMSHLKAYANSSKPAEKDPLDNNGYVTARCKALLDADVVPAILSCCKQTTSPTNIALAVRVLLALAQEQKHRAKMTQQGAVKLLLQIRERVAKTDKATQDASLIERSAAHALARLLISINPAHIFSSSLPVSSAVSALVQLLEPDKAGDDQERNLLPTFEALLALTNLASMDDDSPRELLLRSAWTTLENHLLLSNNTMVQRASVELVCNLMASPSGVAKFADGSKQASNRMHILLALADVEDLATRRAAGGALAMLTEWDKAVEAVLSKERGVKILLGMCEDDNEEMKHRGLVCVLNLVNAPGKLGEEVVSKVKAEGGEASLRESLRGTKSPEILNIGVQALKKLA